MKLTTDQAKERWDKALAGLTEKQISTAVMDNESLAESLSGLLKGMYANMFHESCEMGDYGLILIHIGVSALAAHTAKSDDPETQNEPRLKLDLSALEKLKRN